MQHKIYKMLLRVLVRKVEMSHLVVLVASLALLYRVSMFIGHMEMVDYQNISLVSQAHGATDVPENIKPEEDKIESKTSNPDALKKEVPKGAHKEESQKEQQEFDPLLIDENQVKVIQAISKKEKSLKEIENLSELEEQKKMLEIAHESLTQKIKDLEKVKEEIHSKQDVLTKEEKKNVQTMAKIYEGTKPAQAADIFNKLELTSLIQIIKHMNQKKASAVIANMEANRARQVTLEVLRSKSAEHPTVG